MKLCLFTYLCHLYRNLHPGNHTSGPRTINPLSPNGDQQQFSPNNIHTLSRDKVMRINKKIIIEKIP